MRRAILISVSALGVCAAALAAPPKDSLVGIWQLSGGRNLEIVRAGAGYRALETTDHIDPFGKCKVRKGDAFFTFEPVGKKYRVMKLVYSHNPSNPPGDRGDHCTREHLPDGVVFVLVKGQSLRIQCESYPANTCYSLTRVGGTDTVRPTARALASSGKSGARVKLLFRSSDDSGKTQVQVVVYQGATVLESGTTSMAFSGYKLDLIDAVVWYPPASLKGRFRFCVTAIDPAGNRSARSCSVVVLR